MPLGLLSYIFRFGRCHHIAFDGRIAARSKRTTQIRRGMKMDPGASVAFVVLEAESTRGTDGAVIIESVDKVFFRRVHEIDDEALRDEVSDALTESPGCAVVLDCRETGTCRVWLIPKREMTQLFGTSALLIPEQGKQLGVWFLMTKIGTLRTSLNV